MQTGTKEGRVEAPAARSTTFSILIVDDEVTTRNLCRDVAADAGLQVYVAPTTEEALEILDQFTVDIVVTDLQVPQLGGLELLKRTRANNAEIAIMVLTQYGTIATAIEATRLGATDYVTKPFHVDELRAKLDRLIHSIEADQENRLMREELRSRPGFGGLIGMSPRMQRVYKLIQKVAQHTYPVLILGESGTGKELVARSIHFSGPRKNKPFAPVDCSSLVPTLIESDLFGYVKGAFTGAQHTKQGLFEAAGEGTLFLDEIGDVPIDLQAKLLRALQEREIKPVGSNERIGIRARVIAATNRDLESAIRTGGFRQDMYFRLNVMQIKLPPLRERKADIPFSSIRFWRNFLFPRVPSIRFPKTPCAGSWPTIGLEISVNSRMPSSALWRSAPDRSCTWATCRRTYSTPRRRNIRRGANSFRWKSSNGAPSSGRCRKRRETSWPPRACSA
jgi:DNA-binding NtrC family response regulator